MDENTYQVIITNSLTDDQDKHLVIQKVAALFKISEEKAEQLISQPESVVKKNINKATAEKYQAAIQQTGAQCKIIDTSADEILPEIVTPVTPVSEVTRAFTQTETYQDPEKNRKHHQQLKDLDNFSDKSFCMQCGTIKNSPEVICTQCGHDPKDEKNKNRFIRKFATIILAITAIIIIAYLILMPVYNIFAQKSKFENGLGLAFETRNSITDFILNTGFWPNQNIDANLPKQISNDIIESIIVGENAIFTVTVRASAIN
ncbi:MAG: ribosomal protein L7/L12, partial [Gammaproteobacteria bacterium]|nr:ribosomal protein L7/L12 [Gammaproteobacteria bacterium]